MKKMTCMALLLAALARAGYGEGCRVAAVTAGSAAERAGLKTGDTITAANGKTIRTHSDLVAAVREADPQLRMFVRRGERTDDVTATLDKTASSGSPLGVECQYENESASGLGGSPIVPSRTVPPHSVSIGGGAVFPMAKLDTGDFGAGNQTIGSTGYGAAVQYLYAMNPRWEAGIEGNYSQPGENEFSMPPTIAALSMRSTVVMAIARFHPPRGGAFTPYYLVGLGVHSSELEWTLTPEPGFGWLSGNPTESRSIISDRKTGVALALGLGFDYDFSPTLFMSLEGRLDLIGRATYDANNQGQIIGLRGAEAGGTNGALMVRLGMRFGDLPAPAPAPATPAPGKNEPASDGMM